jgi:hypothetical protein
MTNIPRSKYLGRRLGTQPKDEAEHFIKCEARGARFLPLSGPSARARGAVTTPATASTAMTGAQGRVSGAPQAPPTGPGCSIALIDMAATSDGASATVKNPGAASPHQRTQTQRPPQKKSLRARALIAGWIIRMRG